MKFVIDTSDKRLDFVKQKLLKKGFCVTNFCENQKFEEKSFFVFSPAKKWTENEIFLLPKNITLFCGKVENCFLKVLKEKNIKHINFLDDEQFAIKNANLTAEGVLALILTHSPKSIKENNVLLLGFGRISKACSILFLKLGIKFSIATFDKNKFDESFFVCNKNFFGFDFVKNLKNFDVIVNTRPEKFLKKNVLKSIHKNTLFLETASTNCFDENQTPNFFYLKAPALPQKFCFESAAKIVLDKILGETNKWKQLLVLQ